MVKGRDHKEVFMTLNFFIVFLLFNLFTSVEPKDIQATLVISIPLKIILKIISTRNVNLNPCNNSLQRFPMSALVLGYFHVSWKQRTLNPFTLRATKRGLTILEILYLQSHFLEIFLRRIVYQKSNNNSPSNNLWTFALFTSYFQKYESSRRHFLEELGVWMG